MTQKNGQFLPISTPLSPNAQSIVDELERAAQKTKINAGFFFNEQNKAQAIYNYINNTEQKALIVAPSLYAQRLWIENFRKICSPDIDDLETILAFSLSNYINHKICITTYEDILTTEINDEAFPRSPEDITQALGDFSMFVFNSLFFLGEDDTQILKKSISKTKFKTIIVAESTVFTAEDFQTNPFYFDMFGNFCLFNFPKDSENTYNLRPFYQHNLYCTPTDIEIAYQEKYKIGVLSLTLALLQNEDFIFVIRSHPWIQEPEKFIDDINNDPEFFQSIITFLNSTGVNFEKYVLNTVGWNPETIPQLNNEWTSILLRNIFGKYRSIFESHKDIFHKIEIYMTDIGIIKDGTIILDYLLQCENILTSGLSKLQKCADTCRDITEKTEHSICLIIIDEKISRLEEDLEEQELIESNMISALAEFNSIESNDHYIYIQSSEIIVPTPLLSDINNIFQKLSLIQDYENIELLSQAKYNNYDILDTNKFFEAEINAVVVELFRQKIITGVVGSTKNLKPISPIATHIFHISPVENPIGTQEIFNTSIFSPLKKSVHHIFVTNLSGVGGLFLKDNNVATKREILGIDFYLTRNIQSRHFSAQKFIETPTIETNTISNQSNFQQFFTKNNLDIDNFDKQGTVNLEHDNILNMSLEVNWIPQSITQTETNKLMILHGTLGIITLAMVIISFFNASSVSWIASCIFLILFASLIPFTYKAFKMAKSSDNLSLRASEMCKIVIMTLIEDEKIPQQTLKKALVVTDTENNSCNIELKNTSLNTKILFFRTIIEMLSPFNESYQKHLISMTSSDDTKKLDSVNIPEILGRSTDSVFENFIKRWKRKFGSYELIESKTEPDKTRISAIKQNSMLKSINRTLRLTYILN